MVLALVALLCQWCAACQPDHSPFLPLLGMQINADSCVFIDKCTGVTIKNLKITQTKPRDPKRPKSLGDGHWGVHSGEACGDGMWLRAGPGGHAACVAGIAPQALRWQGNRCQEASSHHPPASRHSPGSSADVLVDGWQCDQGMLHVVGADAMSLFAVFTNGEQRQRRRGLGGCCSHHSCYVHGLFSL